VNKGEPSVSSEACRIKQGEYDPKDVWQSDWLIVCAGQRVIQEG